MASDATGYHPSAEADKQALTRVAGAAMRLLPGERRSVAVNDVEPVINAARGFHGPGRVARAGCWTETGRLLRR
jgi:hypothetical protein